LKYNKPIDFISGACISICLTAKNQTDRPRLSKTSPWDKAPQAVPIIRAVGEAKPTTSPRLTKKISELLDELAAIRKDDPRIIIKLTKKLRVKYTYHTNSIEGNTLTESETRSFIETDMTVSGKPIRDFAETKNIPEALNMIIDMAHAKNPLRLADLLDLHKIVVKNTEEAEPGYFRKGFIRVGNSPYVPPPPYELEPLVDEMLTYVNDNPDKLNPYELAFKTHLWLVSIHPFEDGNGRVTRLVAGLIQLRKHIPPIIIKREHRKRYWSVLRATQKKEDLKSYYDFMAEEYIATLVEYITAAIQTGPEDDLLPLVVAAKKNKIDPEYLSLLARTSVIKAMKSGGRWMIRVKDMDDYMSHRRKPKEKRPAA
jgi:Fic family protein